MAGESKAGSSHRSAGLTARTKDGGSMFASFFVLFLASTVLFFSVALASRSPLQDGAIAAGFLIACGCIFGGVRRALTNPITDYAAWVFRERRGDPLEGYELEKKPASVRRYGTNKPASASDIRKIREQANVWRPTDPNRKRRSARRREK